MQLLLPFHYLAFGLFMYCDQFLSHRYFLRNILFQVYELTVGDDHPPVDMELNPSEQSETTHGERCRENRKFKYWRLSGNLIRAFSESSQSKGSGKKLWTTHWLRHRNIYLLWPLFWGWYLLRLSILRLTGKQMQKFPKCSTVRWHSISLHILFYFREGKIYRDLACSVWLCQCLPPWDFWPLEEDHRQKYIQHDQHHYHPPGLVSDGLSDWIFLDLAVLP